MILASESVGDTILKISDNLNIEPELFRCLFIVGEMKFKIKDLEFIRKFRVLRKFRVGRVTGNTPFYFLVLLCYNVNPSKTSCIIS